MIETLNKALGLPDDWVVANEQSIKDAFSENALVSDAITDVITKVKIEEYGDDDHALSTYEKKLLFTGIQVGGLLFKAQAEQVIRESVKKYFSGDFF